MSSEYPTTSDLERIAGQINEMASDLALTEDERSYLLKKAGLKAHGEESSKELDRLAENVGPCTQMMLDEVIERAYIGQEFIGYHQDMLDVIRMSIDDTRSDDLNYSRPDPHHF